MWKEIGKCRKMMANATEKVAPGFSLQSFSYMKNVGKRISVAIPFAG
jgi:hypothetical protein